MSETILNQSGNVALVRCRQGDFEVVVWGAVRLRQKCGRNLAAASRVFDEWVVKYGEPTGGLQFDSVVSRGTNCTRQPAKVVTTSSTASSNIGARMRTGERPAGATIGVGDASRSRRRAALRRTSRSSPPTAGGQGACDKCGTHSDDLNHITHTTWGDVSLCHDCCVTIESHPRKKPVLPPIRVVNAPIGSGKHR